MSPKKILFLYAHQEIILTGGQIYEDNLYKILKADSRFDVSRRWLDNVNSKWDRYSSSIGNLRLRRELKDYDLVIFNSVESLSFTPLIRSLRNVKGVKTATVHHHFMFLEKEGIRRKWYRLQEMSILRAVDHILIPSPYILSLVDRMLPGHPRTYWQIPFTRDDAGSAPNNPVKGNLLFIGTIEPRKGLKYLIDAMAILKKRGVDVNLTVIGKTVRQDYRDMLDETIAREGLSVRFTGFISAEEKEAIMSQTDIFTFPSLMEGYGMALCESLVKGIPAICFNNSAMPYTIRDGENGLLVADRDTAALADAIARVVTDRELRGQLSRGARESADKLMTPERFREMVLKDTLRICGE